MITIYSGTLYWWDITPMFDPLLMWILLPNLTFYLISEVSIEHLQRVRQAKLSQQRTLTLPDTWSWSGDFQQNGTKVDFILKCIYI